jgi:hypothetical protein
MNIYKMFLMPFIGTHFVMLFMSTLTMEVDTHKKRKIEAGKTPNSAKHVKKLRSTITNLETDIYDINHHSILPLPKGYEQRRATFIAPDPMRADDVNYIKGCKEFVKFIDRFSPPQNIQVELLAEEQFITEYSWKYNERELNSIYIKPKMEPERIINAMRMKKIIKANGFKHIVVPKKYFFFFGDSFRNVSDRITPIPLTQIPKITVEEVKELADFVVQTGFSDFFERGDRSNLYKTSDGKWNFIDTENGSFSTAQSENSVLENLGALRVFLRTYNMGPGVGLELDQKIKNFRTNSITLLKQGIPTRVDLDEPDIDMQAVIEYHLDLNYRGNERRRLFGFDPFDQNNVATVLNKLHKKLEKAQQKLDAINAV